MRLSVNPSWNNLFSVGVVFQEHLHIRMFYADEIHLFILGLLSSTFFIAARVRNSSFDMCFCDLRTFKLVFAFYCRVSGNLTFVFVGQ